MAWMGASHIFFNVLLASHSGLGATLRFSFAYYFASYGSMEARSGFGSGRGQRVKVISPGDSLGIGAFSGILFAYYLGYILELCIV